MLHNHTTRLTTHRHMLHTTTPHTHHHTHTHAHTTPPYHTPHLTSPHHTPHHTRLTTHTTHASPHHTHTHHHHHHHTPIPRVQTQSNFFMKRNNQWQGNIAQHSHCNWTVSCSISISKALILNILHLSLQEPPNLSELLKPLQNASSPASVLLKDEEEDDGEGEDVEAEVEKTEPVNVNPERLKAFNVSIERLWCKHKGQAHDKKPRAYTQSSRGMPELKLTLHDDPSNCRCLFDCLWMKTWTDWYPFLNNPRTRSWP